MTGRTFTVNAAWDAEARVWTVGDSDVPGLAAEADTVEALQAKLRNLIPELLAENGVLAPAEGEAKIFRCSSDQIKMHQIVEYPTQLTKSTLIISSAVEFAVLYI